MNLGNLKSSSGSVKKRKRIGRGPGSGHGKTSTRGHKGQKARSGAKRRAWFEGGQMPLQRRVPKRGFTNIFKKGYQIVNLVSLSRCKDQEVISPSVMKDFGLLKKLNLPVKILGGGEVSRPVTVQANAFSKKAKAKIEALGGKAELI
ncbi:MAG: 50S ribosomal protein L15 [Candidatus Zixiibacteriota bacterium]